MNLNNKRFNSKKFDSECYKKEETQNKNISSYTLTKNHNIDKNCYQHNPEIRNQKHSELKNTDNESKLFGIDRKELCDNFHTCDENTCKTQVFEKITDTNNMNDCNLPTVHSRYQSNNIKEMGINRWENLKYNPQKYAIPFGGRFNNNNIDTRQLVKDTYKTIEFKPSDHTNELEVSKEFIETKTQPVVITPFLDKKKNEYL